MALNGIDEEATNTERFIGALQSLRAVLRDFSEELRRSSERSALAGSAIERIEKAISDLSRTVLEIKHHVSEARDDIEATREQTDPRIRIPPPYRDALQPEKKNDSGKLVALARVAEKVPTPWVAGLLKLSVSAGLGGLALRFIQWLANGH